LLTVPTLTLRSRKASPGPEAPKPFLSHLDELRQRFWVVAAAFVVCFIFSYRFVDPVIAFLANKTGGFIFTQLTEAFMVRVKIAAILGGFLSIPVFLYEGWKFIGAGLAPTERQRIMWALPLSYILFTCGSLIGWNLVLPSATQFLLGFSSPNLKGLISLDDYINFAGWMTMAFGLLFQLPLIIFFSVGAGLISLETLAYYRRHIIVALAILSAVLTPGPDIFSQLAIFLPSCLLFESSYWIARWVYKDKDKQI